jgi:hypothetical protein
VRYQTRGEAARTVVCHCSFCQRCTGSAFAVWPTFGKDEVEVSGVLASYEHRSDESGRWIRLNFCPRCGTTVTSTFEKGPGQISILAGTFDATGWIRVDRHVWTRSKHEWVSIPAGVPAYVKSSTA